MPILKLAFRNIFRYKRRTVITFLTISLSLALLIVSVSLLDGIDVQARNNIIDSQTAHIAIFQKGYFEKIDDLPTDITIANPGPIKALVRETAGVKACEARIRFAAGLIKGTDELPTMGVAVEPGTDGDLFKIKESLVQGDWLEPGDMKVLIGENLAQNIGLAVGDSVTVRMIMSMGEEVIWNALDLEVKGIFDSGNPTVDSSWLILPLDRVREGLSMKDAVTEIAVRLDSTARIPHVREQIRKKLAAAGSLEIYSWEDLAGSFLALSKFKEQRSMTVIFIMLFIAAMGIINTMFMAIFERTREIGMLNSLGMKRGEIRRLFVLEGGFIGMFGSLVGCLIGGLIAWYFEVKGFSLAGMGESVQDFTAALYPVKDVFYADLTAGLLLSTFILGTIVAGLASYYPASRAAKLKPVEALRHI